MREAGASQPTLRRFLSIVGDFITGVRYFGQGFGLLVRRPKLLVIGMLPAILTTVVLLGGMIALITNIGHLAALVTPFADGWSDGGRLVTRLAAGLALVGVAVLLGLVGFTAVTLVVGGPFYEHIAERIEDDLGVTEGHFDLSWWKQFLSGLRDGIVLLLRSLVFTIPLFLAGFLALEVVAVPFYRRGIGLRNRTAMLRRRRMLAIGLGLPAALLCMIPLLAIVVMPAAFAGGVLVARDVLGTVRGSRATPGRSSARPRRGQLPTTAQ
jgi:CysZ protein